MTDNPGVYLVFVEARAVANSRPRVRSRDAVTQQNCCKDEEALVVVATLGNNGTRPTRRCRSINNNNGTHVRARAYTMITTIFAVSLTNAVAVVVVVMMMNKKPNVVLASSGRFDSDI